LSFILLVYIIMEMEGSRQNPWILHVKRYQGEHGVSWKEALKAAKPSYIQKKMGGKIKEYTKEQVAELQKRGVKINGDGGRWNPTAHGTFVWFAKQKTGGKVGVYTKEHVAELQKRGVKIDGVDGKWNPSWDGTYMWFPKKQK